MGMYGFSIYGQSRYGVGIETLPNPVLIDVENASGFPVIMDVQHDKV